MLAITSRTLPTTLFVSLAIILALTTVAEANDFPLQQRDHVNLKRFVKKRSPQLGNDGFPPVIGAAPIPSSTTASSSQQSSSTISSTASGSTSSVSQSVTSSVSTSTTSSSTESSAASSSTSQASSTVSSVRTETPTTPAPETQSTSTSRVQSTKTLFMSVDATETAVPKMASAAAQTKSNILTILIAVAASLGGVAILWTIFRKWKLGRSKKFDERLQPIDWQPTNDDGIIASHRRASSNTSSSHAHANGHGGSGLALPDHDFTAVSSQTSPVGGYADLARGPSPQPPMQEHLGRGPSFNRGFDFGVPLHHQTGYGPRDDYNHGRY